MYKYFAILFFFLGSFVSAQSGTELLKKMHARYYQATCKSYTFSQKNTHYKNDTVSGHSDWHEYVEFPDKFRIDRGEKSEGNYVVFRNDSAYRYKNFQLLKQGRDTNAILLVIGGMYYRTLEDVINRYTVAGFDLKIFSEQKWNGSDVFVIGAKEGDLNSNQLWVNKKNLQVVRVIERRSTDNIMDMRFEAHQDWCKGYIETKVSFRRNGQLEQLEEYYDIKEATGFPN